MSRKIFLVVGGIFVVLLVGYVGIYSGIVEVFDVVCCVMVCSVNVLMMVSYWEIGCCIVQVEQ